MRNESGSFIAVPVEHILLETLRNFSIYVFKNNRYTLYKAAGEAITARQIEILKQTNVENVFIEAAERRSLYTHYEKNLEFILKNPQIEENSKKDILKTVSYTVIEDAFQRPENKENFSRCRNVIEQNFNFFINNQSYFSALFMIAQKDFYTYTHSVNSALFMMGFAIVLEVRDEAEIKEIGFGALVHDIGKAAVSQDILQKSGPLTLEEWEVIKRHPLEGVKIIENYNEISELVKKIIREHHEANDGSGYPYGLKNNQIDFWARLARIVDCYDALTSERAYNIALAPYEALRYMVGSPQFDEQLLKKFISFLNIEQMNKLADFLKKHKSAEKIGLKE